MITGETLTAGEAAEALGVSRSTLYAYVSRGLIRSEAQEGSRRKRYRREDVDKLRSRRLARRDPDRAAAGALSWGAPVLESGITHLDGERILYRGQNALELAREATLEEVAALLWTGSREAAPRLFSERPRWAPQLRSLVRPLEPVPRIQVGLPFLATEDLQAADSRREVREQVAGRILRLAVSLATLDAADPGADAGAALATAWTERPGAPELLRSTLIACADHELNTSAFAARCAASAGSSPYAVVSAGLAAVEGNRHGGYSARVEALVDELGRSSSVVDALAARLRRGEEVPGFHHYFYADGDPRGRFLLDRVAELCPDHPAREEIDAIVHAARLVVGGEPTVDVGLVAVSRCLELPPGGPLALFAIGRLVGYLAHAFEAWPPAPLIRPRSKYVGP